MPQRKSLTRSAAKAGKKVLATDTAQSIIGKVADDMQELTVEKAEEEVAA